MRNFVFVGLVSAVVCASPALAQSTTDLFDQSQGGAIVSASSTIASFEPVGIIGGATSGEANAGNTIFNDGGSVVSPNFVVFTTSSAVTITGVRLFVAEDGNGTGNRGTSLFNFFADSNNNSLFDEAALVSGANPNDVFGTSNDYFFASSITASRFRAEFVGNAGVNIPGPRVRELDALTIVSAPEPGSIALVGIAGLTLCGAVRRRK